MRVFLPFFVCEKGKYYEEFLSGSSWLHSSLLLGYVPLLRSRVQENATDVTEPANDCCETMQAEATAEMLRCASQSVAGSAATAEP